MTTDGTRVKYPPRTPASPTEAEPEFFALIRERPVTRAELPDGSTAWVVSGYEQVRLVLGDPRFSRALAAEPGRAQQGVEVSAAGTIAGMDPPEHTRLRKLVARAFTVRRVEALRPLVAATVAELIDGFTARPQPADLVTSFSLPLPVRVITDMLGVPAADLGKFHGWTNAIVADWERDSGEILVALRQLNAYFAELIKVKRERPGDDLMSALIEAHDSGDRLSEEELTRLLCVVLVGGYETTANQISLSLLVLLDHPDQLARLREDPGLIPPAVEELMRYVKNTSGAALARVTTEDVEVGGVTIPAGGLVLPMLPSANRDPVAFADPDRFDIGRTLVSHLGFGAGAHHCLGAQLARLELQEALSALITRLPGLSLAVPQTELRFKRGMAIHNLRELPITWTSAGRAAR
jgi:cytochrome P450